MKKKVDAEVAEEQEIRHEPPRLCARSTAYQDGAHMMAAAAAGVGLPHLVLGVYKVGVQVQAQRSNDV